MRWWCIIALPSVVLNDTKVSFLTQFQVSMTLDTVLFGVMPILTLFHVSATINTHLSKNFIFPGAFLFSYHNRVQHHLFDDILYGNKSRTHFELSSLIVIGHNHSLIFLYGDWLSWKRASRRAAEFFFFSRWWWMCYVEFSFFNKIMWCN